MDAIPGHVRREVDSDEVELMHRHGGTTLPWRVKPNPGRAAPVKRPRLCLLISLQGQRVQPAVELDLHPGRDLSVSMTVLPVTTEDAPRRGPPETACEAPTEPLRLVLPPMPDGDS